MRVAIVIPCYNDQQFLPQALAAIGAEEATEVVVVDDGSDDPATLRLLDALAKTQVRVLHQRNARPAAPRLAGVAAGAAADGAGGGAAGRGPAVGRRPFLVMCQP